MIEVNQPNKTRPYDWFEAKQLYDYVLQCAKLGPEQAVMAIESFLKPSLWASPVDQNWRCFWATRVPDWAMLATNYERETVLPQLVDAGLPAELAAQLRVQLGFRLKTNHQFEEARACVELAVSESNQPSLLMMAYRVLGEVATDDPGRISFCRRGVVAANEVIHRSLGTTEDVEAARWCRFAMLIDWAYADPDQALTLCTSALLRPPAEGLRGKPLFFFVLVALDVLQEIFRPAVMLAAVTEAESFDFKQRQFNKSLNTGAQALLYDALGDQEQAALLATVALKQRDVWASEPRLARVANQIAKLV